MSELEALDSEGSLISTALAAGHLPHTGLKVMKNYLREFVVQSGCHLLPADADNERGKKTKQEKRKKKKSNRSHVSCALRYNLFTNYI